MSPLFLAAAVDTVVAPYHDEIYVHEWGAMVYRRDVVEAVGDAGGPWLDYSGMMAEAPVIYIYGPEFTGDLTVRSQGEIVNTYPEPDESFRIDASVAGGGSAVRWSSISTRCPYLVEESWAPSVREERVAGFDLASPLWRQVESLIITRESDSFSDMFLYYEVAFEPGMFPLPLPGSLGGGSPQVVPLSGEVLVVSRPDMDWMGLELVDVDDLDELGNGIEITDEYSSELALETVTMWAEGELKEPEIQAMWATWEPYALYGDWEGWYLVIFPEPYAMIQRISTLELTSGSGLPVEYHRFFLGFAPVEPAD